MSNNSKIYAPLVLVVGMLMFLLNYCTKIALCSLVFTLLMFTVNAIAKTFGFKRALQTISAYVGINILLLSDYVYSFNGQSFKYLIPASLLAVLFAAIASMKAVSLLENRIGFVKSSFVGFMAAALVDGIAMSVYFTNYLSVPKIASIFLKEVSFKFVYAVALLAVVKLIMITYSKYSVGKTLRVVEEI